MDITTLLGLIVGIAIVALAILTGSDFWIFLNLPSFLIVVGGTFAATLIKFPLASVFVAFRLGLRAAFVNDPTRPRDILDQAVEFARLARKGGLLALENAKIGNPFFRKGVQLTIDGMEIGLLRQALVNDMELTIQRHQEGEKIFRGIGDSAPAFGMIGTLVGLVQMLSNMEDPKTIGPAMAVALLTTLYGALIANLVALPMAEKLESKTEQERINMSLIIESVVQIQGQQHPAVIAEILETYLPESQRPSKTGTGEAAPVPAPADATQQKAK